MTNTQKWWGGSILALVASLSAGWDSAAQTVSKAGEVLTAGESIAEVRGQVQQMRQDQAVQQQRQVQQQKSIEKIDGKLDKLIEIMLERNQ